MAFDAGAIIASLDIDLQKFDRALRDAEARAKAFSDKTHTVKIVAEFDQSGLQRGRKFYADLDKVVTQDAIARSRSGQGSLLASMLGITSTRQISGLPTGSQAARQGSLGKVLSTPVRQVAPDPSSVGAAIAAAAGGPQAQQQAAKAGDDTGRTFADHFRRAAAGGGGGGGTGGGGFGQSLLGGIGPNILGANFLGKPGLIGGGVVAGLGALPALLGGISPLLAAAPGLAGIGALVKGSLSNIAPLTGLQSQIQNQQTAGLGATAAGAKTIANEQTQLAAGLKTITPAQQQMYTAIVNIQNAWQNLTTSFAPVMAKALTAIGNLFQQLLPVLTNFFKASADLMAPLIGGLGDIAKSLLPLFTSAIRAAIPVIRPLLDGLGSLVAGIFPGLIVLVKASAPAVAALAQVLGGLGKDIGGLFAALAPGLKASGPILKALFDLLGALFPIIGKLATIMANALGPVFVAFASVIKSLLPFLTIIGNVLAALAGAVLTDLVAAFGALATLLKDIAPALTVFAKAISQAFNVLENAGVFAILGDALEAIVKPLAALINAILHGLTPILPVVIGFISRLSAILIAGLAKSITALLPPLTTLATSVLATLAQILPVILPLLVTMAGIFTTAVVAAISGVATALSAIINAVPPSLLGPIAVGILAIVGGVKAWGAATALLGWLKLAPTAIGVFALNVKEAAAGALKFVATLPEMIAAFAAQVAGWISTAAAATAAFIAENAASLGIITAVLAIAAGIAYLATHWKQVWGDIKNWAVDAWHFLENIFHNGIVQDILAVNTLGLVPLLEHWKTVWADAKRVASDLWHWLSSVFGTDIANFFTRTIPGWLDTSIRFLETNFIQPFQNGIKAAWDWVTKNVWNPVSTFLTRTLPGWFSTAVSNIGTFWGKIQNTVEAPVKFVIDTVLDGLISVFDSITNAVGLGKPIPQVHPFGLAGGGRVPGFGGGDRYPALLEGGEAVIDKDRTSKWAWLFRLMGVPGFAAGGIAGNPPLPGGHGGGVPQGPHGAFPGGIGGALHKITDIGKIIAAMATGNITALTNAFSALAGRGTGGAAGELGAILTAIPKTLISDAVHFLIGSFKSAAGPPGGGGAALPAQVAQWVMAAMQIAGAPGSWFGLLMKLVGLESGGNPLAANRTAAGAAAGYPEGIAQVTIGTFAGSHLPGLGNIWNPIDNLVAGIRHIFSSWGSIFNIPGLGAPGAYGGYDRGGWLMPVNRTGQPEAVLNPAESAAFVAQYSGNAANLSDVVDRLEELIDAVHMNAPRTGQELGRALSGAARTAVNGALY